MLSNFKFHHIGYVTDSIANTSNIYLQAAISLHLLLKTAFNVLL